MTRHCPDSVSCRTNSFRLLSFQKILIRNKSVPNFGSSKPNGRGAFERAVINTKRVLILYAFITTELNFFQVRHVVMNLRARLSESNEEIKSLSNSKRKLERCYEHTIKVPQSKFVLVFIIYNIFHFEIKKTNSIFRIFV